MSEDERRSCYVCDLAGAGADVLQGAPPAGEQGEPAFAETAQGPLQGVIGAAADVEFRSVRRLPDRDVDADAGALVAGVSQGGQPAGGGVAERGRAWRRAAVMSWTEPGSASETHNGKPSGASTAWMLPPWACALPQRR